MKGLEMKNKSVFFFTALFIALVSLTAFCLNSYAAENPSKVNVCGKIIYPSFKNGWLLITVQRVIGGQEEKEPIIKYTISQPGAYCLAVPKGTGKVNLKVFNLTNETFIPGSETERNDLAPFSPYLDNPLIIADEDITDADIEFLEIPSVPVMSRYKGETITISGEVSMPDYKEGRVVVTVNNTGFGYPNVASVILDKPGNYSLKVAKNQGDIYIGAFNLLPGESQPGFNSPKGEYSANPLGAKEEDITDININIQ
ncbi:MAG: hypothetical protein PHC29_05905 [Candidatus Omnitrophica bacterium]|nr:hypothetical protein [Candidatus Omnitrophota bacterium]